MKKRVLSLAIALPFFLFSYSQNNRHKGHIALSIGPSLPIGDFADKDITNSSSGIAKPGEVVSVTYAHLLGKRFGISATLQGQRNPLNTHSLENSFSQTKIYQAIWFGPNPNQPPSQIPYSIYPNWKFQKRSWLFGSLLLGGYGEFPVNEPGNISFTTKAMIGVVYASSPKVIGKSITDTATAHIEQTSSSAFGFTYLLNGGIKIDLNKRFCLLTSLEYIGTNKIKFKDIKATITTTRGTPGSLNYSIQQSTVTGEGQQKISTLNLLFGIGIKL